MWATADVAGRRRTGCGTRGAGRAPAGAAGPPPREPRPTPRPGGDGDPDADAWPVPLSLGDLPAEIADELRFDVAAARSVRGARLPPEVRATFRYVWDGIIADVHDELRGASRTGHLNRRVVDRILRRVAGRVQQGQVALIVAGVHHPFPGRRSGTATAGLSSAGLAGTEELIAFTSTGTAAAGAVGAAVAGELLEVYLASSARTQQYRRHGRSPSPKLVVTELAEIYGAGFRRRAAGGATIEVVQRALRSLAGDVVARTSRRCFRGSSGWASRWPAACRPPTSAVCSPTVRSRGRGRGERFRAKASARSRAVDVRLLRPGGRARRTEPTYWRPGGTSRGVVAPTTGSTAPAGRPARQADSGRRVGRSGDRGSSATWWAAACRSASIGPAGADHQVSAPRHISPPGGGGRRVGRPDHHAVVAAGGEAGVGFVQAGPVGAVGLASGEQPPAGVGLAGDVAEGGGVDRDHDVVVGVPRRRPEVVVDGYLDTGWCRPRGRRGRPGRRGATCGGTGGGGVVIAWAGHVAAPLDGSIGVLPVTILSRGCDSRWRPRLPVGPGTGRHRPRRLVSRRSSGRRGVGAPRAVPAIRRPRPPVRRSW
ncbi:MAG: hypothetical protein U5R31_06245 [Acidimicrobiia bacterium]|nr:hypothetical protein [Acidimicrobiia bacterium]